jgi:hypothetical protein
MRNPLRKRKQASRAVQAEAKEGVAFLFGLGAKPKVDPIFRLISDHEAACAAYEPKRMVTADMLPTNPHYRAAEAAESRASDRELKAALAILGCRPTTLMGVLAALEHVSRPEWLTKVGASGTGETILSGMHDCSGKDIKSAAKQFPLRLAAALREIIVGRETEGRDL